MEHSGGELGAYERDGGGGGATQGSGNYITIIPVEYPRRYPVQPDYQYNEYRSREEYYSVQTQKLQAEVNAHLYSVSQRLPALPYSPGGRHAEWERHADAPRSLHADAKESNSSDSLEKSVMGSNMSSCSNQTASSSVAPGSFSTTEQMTSGSSTTSAVSPPLPGSSGSTVSSSSMTSCPVTCVYLMSRVAVMVEMSPEESPMNVTAARFLQAVLSADELGMSQPSTRNLATNVFALWMCSPLLEVQLRATQYPWRVWAGWQRLLRRYGHGTEARRARDRPVLRLQRDLFLSRHAEDAIKDTRILELLYEEARHNVVKGRYPLEAAQAVTLGGLQARLQLGAYDPHRHTAQFFREQQEWYLPPHARSGRWARLLPAGRKGSAEARLLEHVQRAPAAAPPRKLRAKYLDFCRAHTAYGAAFFQGQIEQPVRSLTSLLTHEDIPVLVAINADGLLVMEEAESTVLLGLQYEELSWQLGLPSEDNDRCLPCLFLQFMVVENGLRVSKILQVFSRQAGMMDTLVEHFAAEHRRRLARDAPADRAHPHYDYRPDCAHTSLPPLSRPDSPQRRLANKLSRLALATHDARGNLLGGAGDWSHASRAWLLGEA